MAAYLRFISAENAPLHIANKVSILRRFIGASRVEKAGGPVKTKRRRLKNGEVAPDPAPFFTGEHLDEITPVLVQDFIDGLGVGRKTMRHFRECFHHLFEVCLKFDLYQPAILERMVKKGALIKGNFNRYGWDRTSWYSVDPAWMDCAEADVICFFAGNAKDYGLVEAVLLHNFRYWIGIHAVQSPSIDTHDLHPAELSRRLPFSLATIKRAVAHLEDAGAIIRYRNERKRCSSYALADHLKIGGTHATEANPAGSPPSAAGPTTENKPNAGFEDGRTHSPTGSDDIDARAYVSKNGTLLAGFNNKGIEDIADYCTPVCAQIIEKLSHEVIAKRLDATSPDDLACYYTDPDPVA